MAAEKIPNKQSDKQKAQPSGYEGKNPSTAGDKKDAAVHSETPENLTGALNPAAPNDATNESGGMSKSPNNALNNPARLGIAAENEEGLGAVGYGGETKPMEHAGKAEGEEAARRPPTPVNQPDGSGAELNDSSASAQPTGSTREGEGARPRKTEDAA